MAGRRRRWITLEARTIVMALAGAHKGRECMTMLDFFAVVMLAAAFFTLISPRVRASRNWSAMVTPLASIIGSGFLVSVPLLASTVGIWAIAAVIGLTAIAFLIGSAIRYNIRFGEPIFSGAQSEPSIKSIKSMEMLSHLVLIGAYFISVAYYLVLLAAFGMKLIGWENAILGKAVATVLICTICLIGATKGLHGVERAEKFTVSANLAAIASLLLALVLFGLNLPSGYSWSAALNDQHDFNWDTVRFLMGLVIIVQGFETTRFMGNLYEAQTRINAMRNAQIMSSIIYVVFFILMVPLFPYFTSASDVAGFIDVIGRVTPWLPFIVTAGALASQFSASVADSIGASGLVSDTTHDHVSPSHAYILIGIVAVVVIWATDVISIVALASRAFALFYALQCTVAVMISRQRNDGKVAFFAVLGVISLLTAILGIPAGG